MVANNKSFSILTGGGSDTLDAFPVAELLTGDFAFGIVSGLHHAYDYDEALVIASTNSPYQIVSADNVSGTGAWVLSGYQGAMSHVLAHSGVGTQMFVSGVNQIVVFEIEDYDDLSEYDDTTGLFTAKYPGFYSINSTVLFESTNQWEANEIVILAIDVNATTVSSGYRNIVMAPLDGYFGSFVNTTVKVSAGDTIGINAYQNCDISLALRDSAQYTTLTIDRIV